MPRRRSGRSWRRPPITPTLGEIRGLGKRHRGSAVEIRAILVESRRKPRSSRTRRSWVPEGRGAWSSVRSSPSDGLATVPNHGRPRSPDFLIFLGRRSAHARRPINHVTSRDRSGGPGRSSSPGHSRQDKRRREAVRSRLPTPAKRAISTKSPPLQSPSAGPWRRLCPARAEGLERAVGLELTPCRDADRVGALARAHCLPADGWRRYGRRGPWRACRPSAPRSPKGHVGPAHSSPTAVTAGVSHRAAVRFPHHGALEAGLPYRNRPLR